MGSWSRIAGSTLVTKISILKCMSSLQIWFSHLFRKFASLYVHNIIRIHSGVMWDWHYAMEYSYIFPHIQFECRTYLGIFHGILSVPQNIVMDMNNAMYLLITPTLSYGPVPFEHKCSWGCGVMVVVSCN